MIRIQGKGVSEGVVKGTLCFLERSRRNTSRRHAADAAKEKARFAAAQRAAVEKLQALSRRYGGKTQEAADLFETHALLAEDEDFSLCVTERIDAERCCAEYAVEQAAEQFAALLEQMEDPYMQARAADIRDVAQQILVLCQ